MFNFTQSISEKINEIPKIIIDKFLDMIIEKPKICDKMEIKSKNDKEKKIRKRKKYKYPIIFVSRRKKQKSYIKYAYKMSYSDEFN